MTPNVPDALTAKKRPQFEITDLRSMQTGSHADVGGFELPLHIPSTSVSYLAPTSRTFAYSGADLGTTGR